MLTGAALDRAVARVIGLPAFTPYPYSRDMITAWAIVEWLRGQPLWTRLGFQNAVYDLVEERMPASPRLIVEAWLWATPADLCRALLAVAGPEEPA